VSIFRQVGYMLKLLPWMALACILSITGCSGGGLTQSDTSSTHGAADQEIALEPTQRLYEQVHSARFQLDAALDSIEAAYRKARDLEAGASDSAVKEKLAFVTRILDETGRAMAEHGGPEPTPEDVDREPDKFTSGRVAIVDDANDSLHDLRDAKETLGLAVSLGFDPQQADELSGLIDVTMEDLRGVIRALGGQEEVPSP
jgi:hypothetical protein